jgi:hypothetical protein
MTNDKVGVCAKREPWSVPRLRGRGEQGNIVIHTAFSVSALLEMSACS